MPVHKMMLSCVVAAALAVATIAAARGESPAPARIVVAMAEKTPPIDINTASKADLVALKGVGDKRAADIIKGRPYKGKDELVARKILPQAVYDAIKDKIIAKQK